MMAFRNFFKKSIKTLGVERLNMLKAKEKIYKQFSHFLIKK